MSTNSRFKPWCGKNYATSKSIFTRPTFVLGASTYSGGPEGTAEEDAEWTNELREYYFDGSPGRWKATYTRFINAVYGSGSNKQMREAYFDSIVFNNYLQDFAGGSPVDAPKSDYTVERHFLAFLETIEKHRPEVVICWGSHVWNALPNNWGYGPAIKGRPLSIHGIIFDRYLIYPFADSEILLVGIRHPSTSFRRDYVHEIFKRLKLI